ncbi:hypothetical protein ACWDTR_11475 [Streptomyces sp. NPDC003470]
MNENDCSPLLLSQRECSAIELDILSAASKADVADALNRHDLPEDDFLGTFPDLAKAAQALPDAIPPAV